MSTIDLHKQLGALGSKRSSAGAKAVGYLRGALKCNEIPPESIPQVTEIIKEWDDAVKDFEALINGEKDA
jgi:hypothetical protein